MAFGWDRLLKLLPPLSFRTRVAGSKPASRKKLVDLRAPQAAIAALMFAIPVAACGAQLTAAQAAVATGVHETRAFSLTTGDKAIGISDERTRAALVAERNGNPEEKAADLESKLDALAAEADRGQFADFAAVSAAMDEALDVEQQNKLQGKSPALSPRSTDALKRLYEALLAKCDKKPVPSDVLVKLERQAQMLGFSKQNTPEYKQCQPKVSTAGAMFVASGGGAGLTVSGTVSDPTKPFELHGTFPGGISVHRYRPTGTRGGTSTYTLSGSGVTGTGRGSYTLRRAGADWAVQDTTTGCVNGIPNSCRTNVANIKLTARGAK
jgi:hypothetical protein